LVDFRYEDHYNNVELPIRGIYQSALVTVENPDAKAKDILLAVRIKTGNRPLSAKYFKERGKNIRATDRDLADLRCCFCNFYSCLRNLRVFCQPLIVVFTLPLWASVVHYWVPLATGSSLNVMSASVLSDDAGN